MIYVIGTWPKAYVLSRHVKVAPELHQERRPEQVLPMGLLAAIGTLARVPPVSGSLRGNNIQGQIHDCDIVQPIKEFSVFEASSTL